MRDPRRHLAVLAVCLLVWQIPVAEAVGVCSERDCGEMKRRPQGILTGMPFMTHVASRSFVDDAGRKIFISKPPARIISLAPSITEMVFAVGAGDSLIGVTEFCDFPPEASSKQKVGYAHPSLEAMLALKPDLVLATREVLKSEAMLKLDQLKIPTFIINPTTIEDILAHVQTLGRMLDHPSEANKVTMELRNQISEIKSRAGELQPVRVLYVLNSHPLITVGPGSYIDQLIGMAGGVNIGRLGASPYPHLSMEAVLQQDPEVLLFPIGVHEGISEHEQQSWRQWTTMTAIKQGRMHQIPADLLNRPGPRIGAALDLLTGFLHPDLPSSGRAQ